MTPWWRVVGENGALNPKLPGDQARLLRAEGHVVESAGRKGPRVKGFRRFLVQLD